MQPEEVAGVHFPEHTVQLGGLVVQEAQRGHCEDKHTKNTHDRLFLLKAFFMIFIFHVGLQWSCFA